MGRTAAIYFARFGKTKTGRTTWKLCHPGGKMFGRAFCINPKRIIVHSRKPRAKP
jgi:hypothetical protein